LQVIFGQCQWPQCDFRSFSDVRFALRWLSVGTSHRRRLRTSFASVWWAHAASRLRLAATAESSRALKWQRAHYRRVDQGDSIDGCNQVAEARRFGSGKARVKISLGIRHSLERCTDGPAEPGGDRASAAGETKPTPRAGADSPVGGMVASPAIFGRSPFSSGEENVQAIRDRLRPRRLMRTALKIIWLASMITGEARSSSSNARRAWEGGLDLRGRKFRWSTLADTCP